MMYYQVIVEDRQSGEQVVVLAMATRHEALSFINRFATLSCANFILREEIV